MFEIAIELLETEHERLLVDHYDDLKDTDCDGCQRAGQARVELAQLRSAKREGPFAHVNLTIQ